MGKIRALFNWDDPDEVFARIKDHTTSFASLIGEQALLDFAEKGSASTVIQEYIALHPENEEVLNNALMRVYSMDTLFNGMPPDEHTDIQHICTQYGMKPYPLLELYPDEPTVQSLKPHQVAGTFFPLGSESPFATWAQVEAAFLSLPSFHPDPSGISFCLYILTLLQI